MAGGLHTQARRLDQVASAVADAVALVVDVAPGTIDVEVIPQLAQRDAELVDAARAASQKAVRAAERASRLSPALLIRYPVAGTRARASW